MKIAVIGTGYVGLVTAACFADLGNDVIGIDNDPVKIQALKDGKIPFYEPGLDLLVTTNVKENRLIFTTSIPEGIKEASVVFICVGTPPKPDGSPDLSSIENVARQIAQHHNGHKVIVEKSTVPVQTIHWMKSILAQHITNAFDVAVNPEFLREGSAIYDFKNPDRIVIGTENARADSILTELYKPLNAPIIHTDMTSAELIKHGSNAFLSIKISYANMVARLCDKTGADIHTVMHGIGADKRVGPEFFRAGIGYGGFCFPKDLDAFIAVLKGNHVDASLLESVRKINADQRSFFVEKTKQALTPLTGKTLAVLGLAFKPNTDDMRLAPSIDIINALLESGATINAYDPRASENAKKIFGDTITLTQNPYQAIEKSDAVLILTEWDEFKHLDLTKIKAQTNIIIDGRNLFEPSRMHLLGFHYHCIGRTLHAR